MDLQRVVKSSNDEAGDYRKVEVQTVAPQSPHREQHPSCWMYNYEMAQEDQASMQS